MKNIRISESEKNAVLIRNMADRPNAVSSYGEGNMTAAELKRRLDMPFLLAAEKHNLLCDELGGIIASVDDAREELESLYKSTHSLIGSLEVVKDGTVEARDGALEARDGALKAQSLATLAAETANSSAASAVSATEQARELSQSLDGRILRCERRLTNLEDGVMPDNFYVENAVACEVSVPTGVCKYAEIASLGGMSTLPESSLGEFGRTVVTGVISYSVAGEELDRLMLPDDTVSLEDYGCGIDASHLNRLSWDSDNGRDALIVGCRRLELTGEEAWYDTGELSDVAPIFGLDLPNAGAGNVLLNHTGGIIRLYCLNGSLRIDDYSVFALCGGGLDGWVSYLKERKAEGTPIVIYYPLKECEVVDLGGTLPKSNFILVEGGGKLCFCKRGSGGIGCTVIYQAPSGDVLSDELDEIIALQSSYLTEE